MYSINVVDGKIYMKCKLCEKYKPQGPWGIGNGCNTIQYDVTTHSKSCIHKKNVQKICMTLKVLKIPLKNT